MVQFATDNENGIIKVQSEYNQTFVSRARNLHGKWDKPYWVFPIEKADQVRKALVEAYGDDGSGENVKVRVDLDKCPLVEAWDNNLTISGKALIATRYERDRRVKLPLSVNCIKGDFCPSGGSVKNPRATWINGTVVEMEIPTALWSQCEGYEGITLVDGNKDKRAALEAEKEKLQKRLQEIEQELANL